MSIQMTGPKGVNVKADGVEGVILACAWGVVVVLKETILLWLPFLNLG